MESPGLFDAASARRIVKTVRDHEREGPARATVNAPRQPQAGKFFAFLLCESPTTPGNYRWKKADIVAGAVQPSDPLIQDNNFSAASIHDEIGLSVGTKVAMKWAGYDAAGSPRYLFENTRPKRMYARLSIDGGYDGNAQHGTEASYTYSIYDNDTGEQLATAVPLYTHRPYAQATIPATFGEIFRVTNPTDTGVGGSSGFLPRGSGSTVGSDSGSSSGDGCGEQHQLWRIASCDEQFPMIECADLSASGSGAGSR